VEAPWARPNMSAVAWLKAVDWDDDEADEVNDWMASSAVDAAPRANSMAKLRTKRRKARPSPLKTWDEQTLCHC
jgi:ABC-type proline/glycine betaine transport system substrate-binding protein